MKRKEITLAEFSTLGWTGLCRGGSFFNQMKDYV